MFDPDLNIQRADVNLSFKLADCYYNERMFEGGIKSVFYNMDYFVPFGNLSEYQKKALLVGDKYKNISKLITEE